MKILDSGILSHSPGHGSYMPSILPLTNGNWIACHHIGNHLAAVRNEVEILRSTDSGRTWRTLGIPYDRDPADNWSYRASVLTELTNGDIVLTVTRMDIREDGYMYDPDTECLCRCEPMFIVSQDSGETWGLPVMIDVGLPADAYSCCHGDGIFELADGGWGLVFESWKPRGFQGVGHRVTGVLHSYDRGRTWLPHTPIWTNKEGERMLGDGKVRRLGGNRYAIYFWVHLGNSAFDENNHVCISEDGGLTWAEPLLTNIPGQVCAPVALPDGRVAVIYNYRREVHQIRVAVSSDLLAFDREHETVVFDAADERYVQEFDDEFTDKHQQVAFGWPHGRLRSDGTLLFYFWCTTSQVTHTRWVTLQLD